MTDSIKPTERAIMELVRQMTADELNKRVPSIDIIEPRRLIYFLVEDRIEAYKEKHIKRTLEEVLAEFGIGKKAYYNWYEKYHFLYKQCKKI